MADIATLSTATHPADDPSQSVPVAAPGEGETGRQTLSLPPATAEQSTGSGPKCTLCLDAHGNQATHCVIRPEDYHPAICGLADAQGNPPRTQAAPRPTPKATPQPGCRISLGPIKIEILDPQQFAFDQGLPASAVEADQRKPQSLVTNLSLAKDLARQRARKLLRGFRAVKEEAQRLRQDLSEAQARSSNEDVAPHSEGSAEQIAYLREQQKQWEQQRAETEAELRNAGEEMERLRQELSAALASAAEQAESEAALHEEEAAGQLEQFRRQQRQWEQQRAEAQAELAENAAELERQRCAFHEEQEHWEQVRVETETRVARHADLLDRQLAEAETQRTAFQRQRDQWEAVQAEAQAQLDARAGQLDAREAELDQRSGLVHPSAEAGCDDLLPEWPQDTMELPGGAAVPLADAGLNPGDEVPDDEVSAGEPGDSAQADSAAQGEDEESVDEYMAKLLDRLRDNQSGADSSGPQSMACDHAADVVVSQNPAVPAPQASGPTAPGPPADEECPAAAGGECPAAAGGDDACATPTQPLPRVGDQSSGPAGMGPRAVAPEKGLPLSAMRELAQFSAQSAIATHSRGRIRRHVMTTGWFAVMAGIGAATGAWLWSKDPHNVLAQGTMLSCGVVGLVWTVQYVVMSTQLMFRGSPRPPKD